MTEPIKVAEWKRSGELEEGAYCGPNDVGGLGGFFQRGMRWKDYLEHGTVPESYAEALRASILERELRTPGEWHDCSEDPTIPVFSDGKIATFSWRAWGDLMAAVWSEAEDKDRCYMDFYMYGWGDPGVPFNPPHPDPERQAEL